MIYFNIYHFYGDPIGLHHIIWIPLYSKEEVKIQIFEYQKDGMYIRTIECEELPWYIHKDEFFTSKFPRTYHYNAGDIKYL